MYKYYNIHKMREQFDRPAEYQVIMDKEIGFYDADKNLIKSFKLKDYEEVI